MAQDNQYHGTYKDLAGSDETQYGKSLTLDAPFNPQTPSPEAPPTRPPTPNMEGSAEEWMDQEGEDKTELGAGAELGLRAKKGDPELFLQGTLKERE